MKKCSVSRGSGRVPAELAARLDQFQRVERPTALVTLVAARILIAAERASALDIAVGQETLAIGAIERARDLAKEVPLLQQALENVGRDGKVVLGIGVRKQVERDAELLERFEKALVKALDDILGADAFLFGRDRDGRAVRVRARYHQHIVAAKAVVACENVGGDIGPRELSQMQGRVGIWPGHAQQNLVVHITPWTADAGVPSLGVAAGF